MGKTEDLCYVWRIRLIKKKHKRRSEVTFGELIRSLRICDEISQIELARKMKISKQYLSAIEHNRKFVSLSRAAKFAKVLGYPPDQFIVAAITDELRKAKIKLRFNFKEAFTT